MDCGLWTGDSAARAWHMFTPTCKMTREQGHKSTRGEGKRKALRLERVAGGGGAWAAVCVDTRMKHSKTASATNYPTAAEIGMRHYPGCKLIGHSKHRGGGGGGSAGAG